MKKLFVGSLMTLIFIEDVQSRDLYDRYISSTKSEYIENGVPFVLSPNEDFDTNSSLEKPKEEILEVGQFNIVVDEGTPVTHEEIAGEKNLTSSRPWKAPDFSGQKGALGYDSKTFSIPKGMEKQVQFWIDIYSKYHSDQGVLHDSENIDLIYKEIDFTPITNRTDLNRFQKEARKIRLVDTSKKEVVAMLNKFHTLNDSSSLSPEEKKIWDYFQNIKGGKKFIEAGQKNRLRFQLGQKDRVIQGIFFSGRYIEDFERIFRENNLPIELARLPFVESSFNVLARSKVGASGLWQIMPYTAKGFMKKDPSIDLRNHPIEGTKLAAKLLRNNYRMLESWPLALTGYNHGPTGVLRLTKKYKTRDIAELVEKVSSSKSFGFASRNFYASFLASLEVTSNAPKYLGAVSWSQPLDSVDIKLPQAITYEDVLRWFDGDDMRAQVFNPQITKVGRTKGKIIPSQFVISVPRTKHQMVMQELQTPAALRQARVSANKEE